LGFSLELMHAVPIRESNCQSQHKRLRRSARKLRGTRSGGNELSSVGDSERNSNE
jgi:hypothetical protein